MTENRYKFYIGIDVSKATLDVAISDHQTFTFSNNENGLKELIQMRLNKKHSLIVLEATGGYEKLTAHYLRRKKFNVAVVNAKRVRDFAKAFGKLAKTDRIDAQTIRQFGQAVNPLAQSLL
jgi:transposase